MYYVSDKLQIMLIMVNYSTMYAYANSSHYKI